MNNSIVLSVGETFHLKRGKDRIVYAGMPSERVYSVVQKRRDFRIRDLLGICFIPKSKVK